MILVYCFIGPLPNYAIDTIHQARLFYDGKIYFIISDSTSQYIPILQKYNVDIILYDDVISSEFNDIVKKNTRKFNICHDLKGREKLFIYSFERFFSLHKLMDKYNLTNVFFVELDNLLYDDPRKWEESFNKKDLAFMFDNYDRCASGVCYIKNKDSLEELNKSFLDFIINSSKFITEMTAIYEFWDNHKDVVQILPTIWPSNYPEISHQNYNIYNSIFDAAAIGIYIGGVDPVHTNGIIKKGQYWHHSLINYTNYKYKWEKDEQGRNIPYIFNNEWIRLNNLHIHSKKLDDCLSKSV